MKMRRTTCVQLVLIIVSNILAYNDVRMVLANDVHDDPDALLVRAKRLNYSHVVLPVGPNTTAGDFEDRFLWADSYGLKLIPLLELGSKWSAAWAGAGGGETNRYTSNMVGTCHTWAPEPWGIDALVDEVLQRMQTGFSNAGLGYELEFIHIQHDEFWEPWPADNCLVGHAYNGVLSHSYSDRSFLEQRFPEDPGHHDTRVSTAFQELAVDEIYRRVTQIRAKFPQTRVLVYADAMDPEHNGAEYVKTYYEGVYPYGPTTTYAKLSPGILNLPGLSWEQVNDFRDAVVLVPWNYAVNRNGDDYDTHNTFSTFSNREFDFVYCSALGTFNSEADSWHAEQEYVNTSRDFRNRCVGYFAASWNNDDADNQGFPMLDSLQVHNLGFIPTFNPVTTIYSYIHH